MKVKELIDKLSLLPEYCTVDVGLMIEVPGCEITVGEFINKLQAISPELEIVEEKLAIELIKGVVSRYAPYGGQIWLLLNSVRDAETIKEAIRRAHIIKEHEEFLISLRKEDDE
jgi:hypothetical protein